MTPRRGRVGRGTALLITVITTAVILPPSGSLPKRTPLSARSAYLHQNIPLLLGRGTATTFYAKRDPHPIRCSLSVSRNSVYSATAAPAADDAPPATTATATGGASTSAHQAIAHRNDDETAASVEGEERTVVGEIVLSDWLEDLPLSSLALSGGGQRGKEGDQGGEVEVMTGLSASSARGSKGGEQGEGGDDVSAPFRFQQLIQHMWAELSRGDQLDYLGAKGQAKVKGALTALAAYGALREHPLQVGVNSPQQAFSEMDFNMDGEVSFDEFVRWYSMSSALDEQEPSPPRSDATATPSPTTVSAATTTSTTAAAASAAAVATAAVAAAAATNDDPTLAPPPTGATTLAKAKRAFSPAAGGGGSGASRPLSDLEKSLAPVDHKLGSTTPAQQRSPLSTPSANSVEAESAATGKSPVVLSPPLRPLSLEGTIGLGPTEEEKEAARERWLAGAVSNVVAGGGGVGMEEGEDGFSAAKDLEKAMELLCVLVNADADADTLIAALASCIIRNPMGRYNLEVIEEQFGPIIRGIVEDRLLLERLPEPTSSASYLAIQQSYGVRPVLDLDDYHAKLMRDYLVHSSRDARAVVVHMADLTCRLRERSNTPVYARQSLALEAIQLYVPVSNALGLGSSFLELEELGYKALFPQTYSSMAQWHRGVKSRSHDIVLDVKHRMLEALGAREDIASRVRHYHIEGRTKGLVSTFRKVFRQNKRVADVHDVLGFRIVVSPRSSPRHPREHAASMKSKPGSTSPDTGSLSVVSALPVTSIDDSGRHVCLNKHAKEETSPGEVREGKFSSGGAREEETSLGAIEADEIPVGRIGNGEISAGRGGKGRVLAPDVRVEEGGEGSVGGAPDARVEKGVDMGGRGDSEDEVGVDSNEVSKPDSNEVSKPVRSVFTVKTFPPPYRDDDSRLLHDVYEVLVGLFEQVPGRYKNYVDFPKANGYRSVHTTVLHPSGLKMELQVRTARMHSDAEGGAAAHSLYKGNLENPAEASLFRSKMIPKNSPPVHHRLSSKKGTSATPAASVGGSPANGSPGSIAVPLLETKHGGRRSEGEDQSGDGSHLGNNRSPEP